MFFRQIGEIPSTEGDLPVYRGWSNKLAHQLVTQSRQRDIPPRDAAERFHDLTSANRWVGSEKRPVVYSLGDSALQGVAWFSIHLTPEVPDAEYTFAIRLYEDARGKFLSKPFAELVHDDFEAIYQPEATWLATDDTNGPALRLYESIGYRELSNVDGRVTMVRPAPKS